MDHHRRRQTANRRRSWRVLSVAALAACATAAPVKVAPPAQPFDLEVPAEAPDANALEHLPELWDQESARASSPLETGPLVGPANYDELDGPLSSRYVRSSYVISEGTDDGRKLVARLPIEAARPVMETANQAFSAGRFDDALAAYLQVIERDPLFAKPYFYVAEIKSQTQDLEAATAWNDRGLRLSPRDAYGYALRADILATMGRDESARIALAYALALDPFSGRGLKLLQKLGATRTPGMAPPVFIQRPGPQHNVLVARGGGDPAWQRYAVCRALLAYDARIRGEFVQSPVQERWPGTRSLTEETTCGYLATAAYRLSRAHAKLPPDPDLERWSNAYDANLLREAIIYETIGCRRPDVLPLLPDEVLSRTVEYVRLFVVPRAPVHAAGAPASP
jgi:tetratricopeptide (TPR) repeat protein